MTGAADQAEALARLDEIVRRLRRECPWDREQDERSIVPHTVEEAYELADAAYTGDDPRMLDELGDVLFQVLFLSLLMEERGQGDLAAVADSCRAKLVRRHPHVFGEAEAATAGDVVRHWFDIKREDEQGGEIFGHMPETLPALRHAGKTQRRAESAGRAEERGAEESLAAARAAVDEVGPEEAFERVGELLWHVVAAARALGVDPEVALRQHANEFRRTIEEDERDP